MKTYNENSTCYRERERENTNALPLKEPQNSSEQMSKTHEESLTYGNLCTYGQLTFKIEKTFFT